MFIDEIYESLLARPTAKLTSVHIQVCQAKLSDDDSPKDRITKIKQIDRGYRLFCKRHPEFREDSFRRFCFIRWSGGKANIDAAKKVFESLGWKVNLRWINE